MTVQNLTKQLKYFLAVSITLILVGIIVLFTCGVQPSVELMGGTQIEVNITNTENKEEALQNVVSQLKKQGIVIENAFTENKQLESYVVVRTPNKNISNQTLQNLANSIKTDVSNVTASNISSTISTKYIVMAVVALMLTSVAAFILAWIRYGILSGISMLLSSLHATLLAGSVIVFTRIMLTTGAFIGIAIATLLTIVYNIFIFEKNKDHQDVVTLDKAKTKVHSIEQAVSHTLPTMLIVSAVIVIFAIIGMFAGAVQIVMFMLALLVAAAVSVYSSAFFGMSLEAKLQQNAQNAQKQKLSKNNA